MLQAMGIVNVGVTLQTSQSAGEAGVEVLTPHRKLQGREQALVGFFTACHKGLCPASIALGFSRVM